MEKRGSEATAALFEAADCATQNACLHGGTNSRAFAYLGAHPRASGHVLFRVLAPNAELVSVCGDFNGWDPKRNPMRRLSDGVWELALSSEEVKPGALYKYGIKTGERFFYKSDPYAFSMQAPPESASVVLDAEEYVWRDGGWLQYRRERFDRANAVRQPINIYELHAGSWMRHGDGRPYGYRELAAALLPYVKQMGYTHVELMPLSEHSSDDSWGYQVTGFYAPTARYGTPKDLMAFVDAMHEGGIGVIFDWVPAHFAKDEYGLALFDGSPLYEYADPARAETQWGTLYFDVGRPEVQSFLISNATFWAEVYHVDGLRTDAVASMLYPNAPFGQQTDGRSPEAVAFFQKLNSRMAAEHPDVMMIAEDSSLFPNVTRFEGGGLGFTFKWSLGWMHDALSYHASTQEERRRRHSSLSFFSSYALSERFLLPLSHDEVVHGKRSILDRSPGEYRQKFADTRALLVYQATCPGKKLGFAGVELGMFREWDHAGETEWFLLDYDMHAALQLFVAELNHLYLASPPLWECDGEREGFAWLEADDAANGVYAYCRRALNGEELVAVFNFSDTVRSNYRLPLPSAGEYEEVLNSDLARYGGSGTTNGGSLKTFFAAGRFGSRTPFLRLTLPASSAILLCKRGALHL